MTTIRTRQLLAAAGFALTIASPFALPGRASASTPPDTFDCSTRHSPTCDYASDGGANATFAGPGWRCTKHQQGFTTCKPVFVFCLPNTTLCAEA